MSEEQKILEARMDTVAEKDYMLFEFEQPMRVCLNSDESQGELKNCFSTLLAEMISSENIKIMYVENPDFKNGLYIDVVKEYVKDLNQEIKRVYKKIPEYLTVDKQK
jgi:hypothetical protein